MSSECRCSGGRCGDVEPVGLNRRGFLEKLAVGTAAMTVAGQMAWADDGDAVVPPATPSPAIGRYPLAPRRVYRGKNLEAVGMPLGGIGSGSIWLNGLGQLSIWQIFNNLSEPRVPDSFLAVSAKADGQPAQSLASCKRKARAICGRSKRGSNSKADIRSPGWRSTTWPCRSKSRWKR